MPIETIPIKSLWGLLRWLPGFLIRWHFSPEKLGKLIYADIQPRHESALINLGDSAYFTVYLQVINLSPFSVELDRASFRFWCGGVTLNASILKRQTIAPGEITSLYIHEAIPDGYAIQITKNHKGNLVALDGNIEFNSKVRSFAKNICHLDGISLRILNDHVRACA